MVYTLLCGSVDVLRFIACFCFCQKCMFVSSCLSLYMFRSKCIKMKFKEIPSIKHKILNLLFLLLCAENFYNFYEKFQIVSKYDVNQFKIQNFNFYLIFSYAENRHTHIHTQIHTYTELPKSFDVYIQST